MKRLLFSEICTQYRNLSIKVWVLSSCFMLSGCHFLRDAMRDNDYFLEKFIQGAGGSILMMALAISGAWLGFLSAGSEKNKQESKYRILALILLGLAAYLFFYRFYLSWYYFGRPRPYEW